MRTEPVFIVVNGILTNPGEAREWTDRAVTWLHSMADENVQAEKFEYFASALTRRFRQQRHAEDLAALIRHYTGRQIHLVGHSNGCDLILRALATTSTEIASVHLVAGACDEDFDRNGLNEDITCGQVRHVHVYTSPDDGVLKWAARPSRLLFGWLGLGYGLLGLVGPKFVTLSERVWRYDRPGFGHSTWFTDDNFAATFNRILVNARLK